MRMDSYNLFSRLRTKENYLESNGNNSSFFKQPRTPVE